MVLPSLAPAPPTSARACRRFRCDLDAFDSSTSTCAAAPALSLPPASSTAFCTCACSWLYRIRPSVGHTALEPFEMPKLYIGDMSDLKADPMQV